VNGNSKTQDRAKAPEKTHQKTENQPKRDSGVDVGTPKENGNSKHQDNDEVHAQPEEEIEAQEPDSEAETELEVQSKEQPPMTRNQTGLPSGAEPEPETAVQTKQEQPVDKNAARKEEVRKQRELLRQ
jgi:hypothetical protein